MEILGDFFPVTILLTLCTGLLFLSFFPVKSKVPKRSLFLWLYLLAIPYYYLSIVVNDPDFGQLRFFLNFLCILCFLFCTQFFFIGKIYQKGLVAILYLVFTIISEMIVAMFSRMILPEKELYIFFTNGLGNKVAMIINLLLVFSLWSSRKKRDISIQRNFSIIQLLIALTCTASLGILIISVMGTNTFLIRDYFLMGAIGLLLLLFYIAFEMSDSLTKKNQEYQLQEQRHELLEEYYQQVEKHQQEVRKIKHDLKNQLYSVAGYLETNKEAKANQQINELIQQLDSNELPSFTQHTGLNALLRLHYQKIKQAGITCDFDIKCPEAIGFSDTDLSSLIGNILDNAREACELCDSRKYIQLKMVYFNHSLTVSCENSTDGKVTSLLTRKIDKNNHGLGLKSIRQIVEKYHGNLNPVIDDYSFKLSFSLFSTKDE